MLAGLGRTEAPACCRWRYRQVGTWGGAAELRGQCRGLGRARWSSGYRSRSRGPDAQDHPACWWQKWAEHRGLLTPHLPRTANCPLRNDSKGVTAQETAELGLILSHGGHPLQREGKPRVSMSPARPADMRAFPGGREMGEIWRGTGCNFGAPCPQVSLMTLLCAQAW